MHKPDSACPSAIRGTRHLSLAFWWAWIWLMFFPGLPDQMAHVGSTAWWWATFMVASSVSAIAMLVFFKPLKLVIDNKRLLIPSYLMLSVCSMLLYLLPPSPILFALVFLTGMLSTPWGAQSISRYSGRAGKELVCGVALSLFYASIIYVATIDRPLFVEGLVSALLPVLSIASIYAELNENYHMVDDKTLRDFLNSSGPKNLLYFSKTSGIEKLQLAALFICSSTFGLFGSFSVQGSHAGIGLVIMCSILLAALAMVLVSYFKPASVVPATFFAFPIPFFVSGLLFVVVATFSSPMLYLVAAAFVSIGWVSTISLGWGFYMQRINISTYSPIPLVHILVLQLGTFAGSFGYYLVGSFTQGTVGLTVLTMSIVLVLVFLLSFAAFHHGFDAAAQANAPVSTGTTVSEEQPEAPADGNLTVLHLSQKHGLSEREQEILECLLKGYSLPRIAEQLSVAKSTVATHCQHIYKKLDVHTKQELITLAEGLEIGQ